MGQILGIGLATHWFFAKSQIEKYNITSEQCLQEIQEQLQVDITLYDFSLQENYYQLAIKESILEKELIPFLEQIYPLLYRNRPDFKDTLQRLSNENSAQSFLDLANKKMAEEFQIDEYGESEYLYIKPNIRIDVSFNTILLSHEGKIMMEVYGRQFTFFQQCIQKSFPDFLLSKTLKVYISG